MKIADWSLYPKKRGEPKMVPKGLFPSILWLGLALHDLICLSKPATCLMMSLPAKVWFPSHFISVMLLHDWITAVAKESMLCFGLCSCWSGCSILKRLRGGLWLLRLRICSECLLRQDPHFAKTRMKCKPLQIKTRPASWEGVRMFLMLVFHTIS